MNKFIMHVPEWDGNFVFSGETLLFLVTLILAAVGLLFCFKGYRYFQTFCFIAIAGGVLYIAYLLTRMMTSNPVLLLILSVTLMFMGMSIVYFAFVIVTFLLDKLHLKTRLAKHTHILSGIVGALILGLTVYFGIYSSALIAVLIGGGAALLGYPVQRRGMKKKIRYKSYHDLMKVKLPEKYVQEQAHAAGEEEGAGQEDAEQEGAGQEDAEQEDAEQEGAGQEDAEQEDAEQEGAGQEDTGQEAAAEGRGKDGLTDA